MKSSAKQKKASPQTFAADLREFYYFIFFILLGNASGTAPVPPIT